jgi:hypothetical protein
MAGLARILSIAALIVHLMVGCCSHHAQGYESKDCSAATGEPTPDGRCTQCLCDHHGTEDCQRCKCFLPSPRRTVAGSVLLRFQTSFAALPDDRLSGAGIASHVRFRATGRLLMPVRLHLANQVLLI